jgi:beta-aspartyl-dipeptidase (metallo-type)
MTTPLLIQLKNADIYSPDHVGIKDVLLSAQVVDIRDKIELTGTDVTVIDVQGDLVVPGFVDSHVHIIGGGGEKGPASRVPESQVSEFIEAGITTVIGVLGTDNVSRNLETVLFKARALNEDGITAYMYTGSYHFPVVTLTGSVKRDITLVEQVIGVGEICISDHRSSYPSMQDLLTIASEARVAGMLSGKSGKVHVHMGDGETGLGPLWKIVKETMIPITTFVPTHMCRNPKLFEEGKTWLKEGGWFDLTAEFENGQLDPVVVQSMVNLKQEGHPLERVTVSSDAFGSLPTYDSKGELVGYTAAQPTSLLELVKELVKVHKWTLTEALRPLTINPAVLYLLNKQGKGQITVGGAADLLVLDKNTLELKYVIAKGKILKKPGYVKKGMFEK